MPDATELCALADVKTMLGITTSAQDALLTIVKNHVEQFAKTFCGRDFIVTSYTEYHDGYGDAVLRVNQRPITAISAIYSDPALLYEAASLIPSTDYVTDTRGRELGYVELNQYRFLRGRKATKITYSAGYSTIPYDLSFAVKKIIAQQFKIADKKLYAEVTQQVGDQTITLNPDAYPKDAMKTLEEYRRLDF